MPTTPTTSRFRPPPGMASRLFATCWLVYALHFATNTVRELYPALSLGDRLSFDVSEYRDLHPDIFEVPGRGTFINSNPGASMLGAIPYALARPVIGLVASRVERARATAAAPAPEYRSPYPLAREFHKKAVRLGLDIKFGLAAAAVQVGLMAPLSALSVVVMLRLLAARGIAPSAALGLALLYAFATPVFYRTAQLNQNLLLSHCALFAFVLLWRPGDDPARPRYLAAGALAGGAVLLDYSGLVVVPILSAYALLRRRALPAAARAWGDFPAFALGVSLGVGALLAYQWAAFGHPLRPAQSYMPPATFSGAGYHGVDWPRLDLLGATAFSARFGLFTSAPLLLLALYVPGWWRGGLVARREAWCVVALSLGFFLFASMNQYGWMQFNSGVRHVVPATPFLFLLAAQVLLRLPTRPAVLIALVTTYWSWCLTMYRDVERGLGIPEAVARVTVEGFRLPWLTTLQGMGYVPAGTSPMPLLVLAGAVVWVLWRIGLPRDRGPAR